MWRFWRKSLLVIVKYVGWGSGLWTTESQPRNVVFLPWSNIFFWRICMRAYSDWKRDVDWLSLILWSYAEWHPCCGSSTSLTLLGFAIIWCFGETLARVSKLFTYIKLFCMCTRVQISLIPSSVFVNQI